MEWSWLGAGAFGIVLRALEASRSVDVAVKFVAADEDYERHEIAKEALILRLLSRLRAPAFPLYYGAQWLVAPWQWAGLVPVKNMPKKSNGLNNGADTLKPDHTGVMLMAQEYASGGSLLSALRTKQTPAATAAFLLVWSITHAQGAFGVRFADIHVANVLWQPLPKSETGVFVLLFQHQDDETTATAAAVRARFRVTMTGRPLLIDMGKSNIYSPLAPAEEADLRADGGGGMDWAPATSYRPLAPSDDDELALHSPPELLFRARASDPLPGAPADWWQMGVLLFTIAGWAPARTVLSAAERQSLDECLAAWKETGDLVDLLPYAVSDATLFVQFQALLEDARQRVLPTAANWKRRINDAQNTYGHLYRRFLGVILLQQALGNALLPPLPPDTATAPPFLRLLHDLRVYTFLVKTVGGPVGACYRRVVGAMDPEARALIARLLAWAPAERPSGVAVLEHAYFAHLREPAACTYVMDDRPPLTMDAPAARDEAAMAARRDDLCTQRHVPVADANLGPDQIVLNLLTAASVL